MRISKFETISNFSNSNDQIKHLDDGMSFENLNIGIFEFVSGLGFRISDLKVIMEGVKK